MKVEVWSDIACPFCYIGKRRFEAGLAKFAHKEEIEVVYRSFQLDPNAEKDPEQDAYGLVAKKYGISREQSEAMHENLVQQAAELGLTYNFEHAHPANSLDAHRLIHYAGRFGKRTEAAELLFKAYFTDSKRIGRMETLIDIAAELGLDPKEAEAVLSSDEFTEEVQAECREASQLGANGVPFYVINRKYAVAGAQPSEVFLDVLNTCWEEEKPLILLDPSSTNRGTGQVCTDDSCGLEDPNADL
ncbi:DsbA family oxidoreductase [Paenibacillus sacheonensis]|uniref:Thioredoxin domain-containing protein n=1 Tax=Paenibacillus sacheonensis TaxID=742054 RepID=A0A7X4YS39_9BACL|nr:DsbA family oxidoreductase [Paenibacillus sacheonensis]MBM7566903.1 putative DsbA family dithiol-disulfide isomerase [Paenibacillus sacheonensis]NBC71525.1 thioredoxin domain-containing protein [Paenibacillus sacheonensis]